MNIERSVRIYSNWIVGVDASMWRLCDAVSCFDVYTTNKMHLCDQKSKRETENWLSNIEIGRKCVRHGISVCWLLSTWLYVIISHNSISTFDQNKTGNYIYAISNLIGNDSHCTGACLWTQHFYPTLLLCDWMHKCLQCYTESNVFAV